MKFIAALTFTCLLASPAFAAQSSYTTYDFNKNCTFDKPSDGDEGMGSTGLCEVAGKPDIYFLDGDLRQSAGFGALKPFESFGSFNNMNTVVEWRATDQGEIFAAIVRFFVSYYDEEKGDFDANNQSQILVIHRVAQTTDDQTCVVGMVDARANANANILARQVADNTAIDFNCKIETPRYTGIKGKQSAQFSKPMPAPEPAPAPQS